HFFVANQKSVDKNVELGYLTLIKTNLGSLFIRVLDEVVDRVYLCAGSGKMAPQPGEGLLPDCSCYRVEKPCLLSLLNPLRMSSALSFDRLHQAFRGKGASRQVIADN